MNFEETVDEAEFRESVRDFMGKTITQEMLDETHGSGTMHDWGFYQALAEQGWIGLSWPKEFGGQGRTPLEAAIFFEEANRALAPLYGMNTSMVAARAVLAFAKDELAEKIVTQVLKGEIVICLGYSEPDSGSDVANARTTAVRDGDSWIVNGQKVFTSSAEVASYVMLLTRTDTEVAKHQGLTVFLVPMDTPGIEIAPIMTLGERTNMTFYRDVLVPDAMRIGEVNGGWEVMTRSLSFERGGHGFQGHLIRLLDDVMESIDQLRTNQGIDIRDDRCHELLGRFATAIEVARLLDYRTALLSSTEHQVAIEGSMAKLFGSETFTKACSDFMDLLGPFGLLQEGEAGSLVNGAVEYAHRFATPTTVYGGVSEVQKSIIAEGGLGLPRSR
jgi:alkylation response protein AidB-like acyl-CoA dehydrogenase